MDQLPPETLQKTNPRLIIARVSGYGQDGPNAHLPGYASVCEAYGGFRHVNGFPGQPPVRPNISLGDTLAGFHAAFGVLLALLERTRASAPSQHNSGAPDRGPIPGTERQAASCRIRSAMADIWPTHSPILLCVAQAPGCGQVVDAAIYESIYNVMEAIVPEYDRFGALLVAPTLGGKRLAVFKLRSVSTQSWRCLCVAGKVRGPSGSTITGIAPTNTYLCQDSRYVVIGANGESIFKRLAETIGRLDLVRQPR